MPQQTSVVFDNSKTRATTKKDGLPSGLSAYLPGFTRHMRKVVDYFDST